MIITHLKIITCTKNPAPIEDGAVVITNGIIEAVGPSAIIMSKFRHHPIVNLPNAVLLPGLLNIHAHLELPKLLESIQAHTFSEWVLNLIQAKKKLSHDDYTSSVIENISTLIQTGTTTVGEICTHGESPAILKKSGMRAIVYREIIEMRPEAKCLLSNKTDSALMEYGLSPHAPYTVSEKILRKITKYAPERQIKLSMHVAESKDEIKLLQQKKGGLEKLYQFAHWDLDLAPKGSTSIDFLHKIGLLSPLLLAVHAVQVTDKDVQLIKKSRTSVAHCPRSNKELGVGSMPLKRLLDAGVTVGLGTDSLASVPSLNMWDEMRYAYRIHRRDGITPLEIFKLATISGAKALGLDKKIGTLEPGKKADIIAVPLPKKNTGDLYSDLLRETKSCIMTMVNGKILFRA